MRWMVGIDLAGRSDGAVELARWIAGRASTHRFVGTHVIPASLVPLLIELEVERQEDAMREAAARVLEPLRTFEVFSDLGSIPASTAEDGLEAAVEKHASDAMMIGRRKPAAGKRLSRLGRVGRRLLRRLPTPVLVVPPDLRREELSGGPILVGTDLGPSSAQAAKFAKDLGHALGLDLLVTHVAGPPRDLQLLVPADDWGTMLGRATKRGRAALEAWVGEHGLDEARTSVVDGDVPYQLLEVAKVSGASMIVVGSRGLSGFDRLFGSSVATELAAEAPIPVAVVPGPQVE